MNLQPASLLEWSSSKDSQITLSLVSKLDNQLFQYIKKFLSGVSILNCPVRHRNRAGLVKVFYLGVVAGNGIIMTQRPNRSSRDPLVAYLRRRVNCKHAELAVKPLFHDFILVPAV